MIRDKKQFHVLLLIAYKTSSKDMHSNKKLTSWNYSCECNWSLLYQA